MGYRRVCKTASQWRQALGPDWRQSVSGARGVQDEVEAMSARMSPDNEAHGQPVDPNSPGAHTPSPN